MEPMMFAAAVRAVNDTLARRSARHGGLPCPEGARAVRRGVLGLCDLGCLDDAIALLERVVERLARAAGPTVPHGYLTRVVRSCLGDLNRERRRASGTQQRPERVPDAAWARRALPDPADRALLAHLMTWLGSDVPAVAGTGWPLRAWAERYGTTPARMAERIRQVMRAVEVTSPERYDSYLARPLADKTPVVLPFSALRGADPSVDEVGGAPLGRDAQRGGHGPGDEAACGSGGRPVRGGRREPARPLWEPSLFPSSSAASGDASTAERRIAGYRLSALAGQVAARHGTGRVGARELRVALVREFGAAAAGLADGDLGTVLRRASVGAGAGAGAGAGDADGEGGHQVPGDPLVLAA